MSKNKFSKLIVISIVLLNIIFVIAVFYVFLETEEEPTELIRAWFAFTTGELWMLSSIKKTKVKKENEENGGEDYENKV